MSSIRTAARPLLAWQVVETMLGGVDAGVLERLAKVMGYMRVTAAGKPGKRLKKREKLQMLGGGGGGLAVRPLNGAAHKPILPDNPLSPHTRLHGPTSRVETLRQVCYAACGACSTLSCMCS